MRVEPKVEPKEAPGQPGNLLVRAYLRWAAYAIIALIVVLALVTLRAAIWTQPAEDAPDPSQPSGVMQP